MKTPILLILILLVSACAKKGKRNSSKIVNYNSLSNSVIELTKTDCSVISGPLYTDYLFPIFIKNKPSSKLATFQKLLLGNEIKSADGSIITDTNFGQELFFRYKIESDLSQTYVDGRFINFGDTVNVCEGLDKYKRGTAEAATLAATYSIAKTKTKINEVMPDLLIPAITVYMAPLMKVEYKGKVKGKEQTVVRYRTDNAYYSPGSDQMTFLPHSKEAQKEGFGAHSFWEIPMVPSHEYGHHIFHTVMTNVKEEEKLESILHTKLCFDNRIKPQSKYLHQLSEEDKKRDSGSKTVLDALNEGFADLISFYTLSNAERTLKGVKCLEVTRDVGSAVLKKKELKTFNDKVYQSFFSSEETEDETLATCEVADYQDIHVFGAIFAHQADLYLNSLKFSKDKKLKVILTWLKNLNTEWPMLEKESGKNFMKKSYLMLIEEGMKEANLTSLNKNICEVIISGFKVEKVFFETSISGCL